jgi:hypothetical protein
MRTKTKRPGKKFAEVRGSIALDVEDAIIDGDIVTLLNGATGVSGTV